jgi:hypothetical protein
MIRLAPKSLIRLAQGSRRTRTNRRSVICLDCRYIRERPSGIGVWVQELVDHLPELAPDLDFLFIKHPKAPSQLSRAPNVQETVVAQEANGLATMFWLPKIVELAQVDIYHNTFNVMPYWLPVRTVVTLTDIMQVKHPSWAKEPGLWGWLEVAYKRHGIVRAFRHADRIVAVSKATRDEIATVDPRAAARTRVALQGVSPIGVNQIVTRIVAAYVQPVAGAL